MPASVLTLNRIEKIPDTTEQEGQKYLTYDDVRIKKGLRIISANVRSIYKKQDELNQIAENYMVDFFALQETWEVEDKEINLRNFNRISGTVRKKHRGGGTGIYAHKNITGEPLPQFTYLEERKIEISTAIFQRGKKSPLIIINVYLGFSDQTNSILKLKQTIEGIRKIYKSAEIISTGDFNINHLDENKQEK